MKNYILCYILDKGKGKCRYQMMDIGSYPWRLEDAKKRAIDSATKQKDLRGPDAVVPDVVILKLPDNDEEKASLISLALHGRVLTEPTRYCHSGYMLLRGFEEDEKGVDYIAGWYRTQGDAKEAGLDGRLVKVVYKGSKVYLTGNMPTKAVTDLWEE